MGEMKREPVRLRTTVAATTAILTLCVLALAASLIVMTTILRNAAGEVRLSVESIVVADEARVSLLLHERASDVIVKRKLESDLRERLEDAHRFVTTERDRAALANAEAAFQAYTGSSVDGAAPLYAALDDFVDANVDEARAAEQLARGFDQAANRLGVAVAGSVIALAILVIAYVMSRAFAPIVGLAAVMRRFAAGDGDARAVEDGPRELRDMSRTFNDLASAISNQRARQVAFLGGVAHDLRNPLAALRLTLGLLPPDKPLPPEDRVRQLFARLGVAVGRMDRMVSDFLEIQKIESGHLELRVAEHDLREVVKETLELFEGATLEHELHLSLPTTALPVRCDTLRIGQVLTNLVSNALKYSPAGSAVDIDVAAAGGRAILRVTDRGVGISAEDQRVLFEPFRRVGLTRDGVPGAGLGLFVVKKIVDAHGGSIAIESEPGRGTTFMVSLPA